MAEEDTGIRPGEEAGPSGRGQRRAPPRGPQADSGRKSDSARVDGDGEFRADSGAAPAAPPLQTLLPTPMKPTPRSSIWKTAAILGVGFALGLPAPATSYAGESGDGHWVQTRDENGIRVSRKEVPGSPFLALRGE